MFLGCQCSYRSHQSMLQIRSWYCVVYSGSGFPQNVCASEKISNRDNAGFAVLGVSNTMGVLLCIPSCGGKS